MIPIRDENPVRSVPWMTLLLMAVNIAVFLYESSLADADLLRFITEWGLVPSRFLASPTSPVQLATVFTSMFMHAGWLHLIGNMLYLWIFGNNVEDRLGPLGFLGFYVIAGTVASAAQIAAGGAIDIPTVGASGAVAGVLGAYVVLYPGASVLTIIPIFVFVEAARLPAFIVIGFWFLLQVGNGVASLGAQVAQTGGVAWFAHIGGFALGAIVALGIATWDRVSRPRYRGGWS
ncbi:MAG: rhomboid family intramembrane serine protease [Coriobacteriia bacterium]